jgi:hypothetical protein
VGDHVGIPGVVLFLLQKKSTVALCAGNLYFEMDGYSCGRTKVGLRTDAINSVILLGISLCSDKS